MSEIDDLNDGAPNGDVGRREFLRRAGLLAAATGPLAISGSSAASLAQAAGRAKSPFAGQKLAIWYLTGSPAETKYINFATSKFAKADQISAKVTPYNYAPMNLQLKLALRSGTGPDVAYANPSHQDQQVYQQQRWIINLSSLARKYNWYARFPESVLTYWNRQCCSSVFSGIPFDVATVGWFYNTQFFAQHGLKVPQTWPQFQALVAKLKSMGVATPVASGGPSGQGTMIFAFEQFLAANWAQQNWYDLMVLKPSAKINTRQVVQALTIAQDWTKNGYFGANALAQSGTDAMALFTTGKAPLHVNGSWATGQLVDAAKFKVGFFRMPMINRSLPATMSGYSPNNQWMINSKAHNPKLAADYLNYMLSEPVARILWANGDIPAYKFKRLPKATSQVQSDIYTAMQKCKTTGYFINNIGGYFSVQYPNVMDSLFSGSITPQACAQTFQTNYVKSVKGQNS